MNRHQILVVAFAAAALIGVVRLLRGPHSSIIRQLTNNGASISYRDEWDYERQCYTKPNRLVLFLSRFVTLDRFRVPDLINLEGFTGSSDDIKTFCQLTTLTHVMMLPDQSITDDIVPYLKRLPHLRCLQLSQTSISDAGLLKLADLPNLKQIIAIDTGISRSGQLAFVQLRPDCDLVVDAH